MEILLVFVDSFNGTNKRLVVNWCCLFLANNLSTTISNITNTLSQYVELDDNIKKIKLSICLQGPTKVVDVILRVQPAGNRIVVYSTARASFKAVTKAKVSSIEPSPNGIVILHIKILQY